jgi:hypothetical protein
VTRPIGHLWVNPDGVIGVGDAYAEHVALYNRYVDQLVSLRDRYGSAWGDDDMGKEFSTKFLQGLDNLEALVGGIRGTLDYTAEGLRQSGKLYREADEDAREVGERLARDFESLDTPVARKAVMNRLVEPAEGEQTPVFRSRMAVQARLLRPDEEPGEEGDGSKVFLRSRRLATEEPVEDFAALEPMQHGVLARGELLEPMEALEPLTPATPAISSLLSKPEYTTAYVGGEPLPEGYRLQALNPFDDGTSRVDANLYESVTPLAGTPVTTPQGQVIDPEGRHFFVVRDNPAVDPTAPGYQPLYLSYSADGTPTPLF